MTNRNFSSTTGEICTNRGSSSQGRPSSRYFCSSPVSEVDDLVEEERPSGGAGEPRRDELVPVRQEGVALRAREQPLPPDVLQVNPTHLGLLLNRRGVLSRRQGSYKRSFHDFLKCPAFLRRLHAVELSSISASAAFAYFS